MKIASVVFAVVALIPRIAEAQRYERILFPLVVNQHPGAYGSSWMTQASVWNGGEVPVELFTSECYYRCTGSCAITMCFRGQPTPPRTYYARMDLDRGEFGSTPNPASLLYVERDKAASIAASLHLVEQTYRTMEFGVEMPVVREHELFTTTLTLPRIPMPRSTEGRVHLRVYGVESPSGAARVRVRAYAADAVTLDETVDLQPPRYSVATPRPDEFDEPQPSYLMLLLTSELSRGTETIRVTVDPITPGLKFWAMASVTTNVTQHVTIVSPQ